ncbi:hypothetical protein P3T76_014303 [Phytophthora citrophthora]|uniref:Uncharacterized protein n=1 Tax=Phytophthora citrophthora TaxID=4793 RepID=A0AAD9LC99_9STRA|nr:hypothetical protein P3T76_014303 [Phytophthora citrophthora]
MPLTSTLLSVYLAVSGATATAQSTTGTLITGTDTTSQYFVNMDPNDIVNGQFGAVPPISSASSTSDVVNWLGTMDEIFTRVATGGLTTLPTNGFAAIETMKTEITTAPDLLSDAAVLKSVLHVLPSLWDVGFWYKPVDDWKTSFGCVFNKAVSASKLAGDSSCYDAAVNATSLMVRFTKDQVFWNGEDQGDSVELQGQNKDYLAYLPELVAQLSKKKGFTLTEAQLRTFMATKMPSKTEGMDTAAAFPVFVDTSIYKASDAAALAEFVR